MARAKEQREQYEQHSFDQRGNIQLPRRLYGPEEVARLHEALEPFLDIPTLRRCVAEETDIYRALRCDHPPRELQTMLNTLAAVLRPAKREQVRSPQDVAALLMVEMGNLQQEELRTVLLDTKNRIQAIPTVYKGSLNTSMIRVGEVFREAVRWNSAALIVAHNHPSSDPTPSPEDVLVTREIVAAGRLLDCEVLDHLILSSTKWVSLRERGLGF